MLREQTAEVRGALFAVLYDGLQTPIPIWLSTKSFDEPVHKDSHLWCQFPRTWVQRPKRLCGNKRVLRKGWYQSARSKLVGGAPGGHKSDTEPRTGRIPDGTTVIDPQSWGHAALNLLSISSSEGPKIERANNEAGVFCEVVGRVRPPMPLYILRRCDEHPLIWSEPTCDEGRVTEFCIAHRHIEGTFDEIDDVVRDTHVERQIGILTAEVAQTWHNVHARERGRSRDPQGTTRCGLLPSKGGASSLCCVHEVFGMRQERKAILGQGRLPRRAVEKPGTKFFLERCQSGARSRRRNAQIAGCCGDALKLSDAHE